MDDILTISSLVEQMEIPDEFVPILVDSIALLPGEKEAVYFEFISLMTIDINPKNNIEWLTVFELAALLWDQKRYRGWKRAIILHNHMSAVEQALLKSDPGYQLIGPKNLVRAQARQDAQEWKQSEAAREKFRPRMEAIGYNSDGLHAEAFSQSATTLVAIEQLLASIRRQISRLLADVCVRREFRNRARRFAAQLVLLETSPSLHNKDNSDGV